MNVRRYPGDPATALALGVDHQRPLMRSLRPALRLALALVALGASPAAPAEPVQALVLGAPAPALAASDWYNGPPPSLESLRGKVVLLDFWGVWCAPCRAETAALMELHRLYAARGLVVVGVHTPQQAALVPRYLEEHGVPYPVLIDRGPTAKAYGVTLFPTHVLIDVEGKVAALPRGFPSTRSIERLLEAVKR